MFFLRVEMLFKRFVGHRLHQEAGVFKLVANDVLEQNQLVVLPLHDHFIALACEVTRHEFA